MYDEGQGVPRNYSAAAIWYRKSADQGNAGAQFKLGAMYEKARGVRQDDAAALDWYRKAGQDQVAYRGGGRAPWAQAQLAFFYEQGRGGLPEGRSRGRAPVQSRRRPGNAFAIGALERRGREQLQDRQKEAEAQERQRRQKDRMANTTWHPAR